jgi:hypothetical protein
MGSCIACSHYVSFINNTNDKTLDDYLTLFRRLAITDLVLAVVYAVQIVETAKYVTDGSSDVPLEHWVVLALGACVTLFWLVDAVLMLLFRCRVQDSSTPEGAIRADRAPELVSKTRVLLAVSSLGLCVYVCRFGVELWQAGETGALSRLPRLSIALFALALLAKVLRGLAFNTFGNWARMRTDDPTATSSA